LLGSPNGEHWWDPPENVVEAMWSGVVPAIGLIVPRPRGAGNPKPAKVVPRRRPSGKGRRTRKDPFLVSRGQSPRETKKGSVELIPPQLGGGWGFKSLSIPSSDRRSYSSSRRFSSRHSMKSRRTEGCNLA